MEEFDVKVKAGEKMAEVTHEYPNKTVHLSLYRCDYIEGDFKMHDDHLEYTWVHKEDLQNFELAAADLEIIKKIQG